MDIGSIATVVVVNGIEQEVAQPPASQAAPQPEQRATEHLCSVDAECWPIDEEGWQIDGYFDPQTLNFVKGEGKGKSDCFNGGGKGHYARGCPKPKR